MAITATELANAAVASGLVETDVATGLVHRFRRRPELVEALTSHGRFPSSALYRALAEQRGLPFVDLDTETCDPSILRRIPEALLTGRHVAPFGETGGEVLLATADPDDQQVITAINRHLSATSRIVIADPDAIVRFLQRAIRSPRPVDESDEAADVVAMLETILKEAYLWRASDVHIEPQEAATRIRLRIDGRLQEFMGDLAPQTGISLLSRIKVLSNLDIAEQRAPQDGRFSHQISGDDVDQFDIRVATAPTRWGERATMRLLGTESIDFTLANLGMSENMLQQFEAAIRKPFGMVLLTGPTGSGKSTTLYAALRKLNQPHVNILTVEDPIEYLVPGISQMHIGGTDKVTFPSALRSLLRHDPDVMMIGEIRDMETADVAMKSAMTGHMIFSTLHTNTACGAVTRLVDIGCEPFLVGATLAGVIAQRLVRRLCTRCRIARQATEWEAEQLGQAGADLTIHEANGCANCLGSGYRGRIGLFEALWIDSDLSRLIGQGVTESELQAHADNHMTRLHQDGCEKVLDGLTSLDEVLRATMLGT